MLVCIIAFAISWATVGAMAFNGGALGLLTIGISVGLLVPTFDEAPSRFGVGLVPDLLIVCLLWWAFTDVMLESAGGPTALAKVLAVTFFIYAFAAMASLIALRASVVLRRFACLDIVEANEPRDATKW